MQDGLPIWGTGLCIWHAWTSRSPCQPISPPCLGLSGWQLYPQIYWLVLPDWGHLWTWWTSILSKSLLKMLNRTCFRRDGCSISSCWPPDRMWPDDDSSEPNYPIIILLISYVPIQNITYKLEYRWLWQTVLKVLLESK